MKKLDLTTLEKKLWDCADILRGTLNSWLRNNGIKYDL